MPRKSRRPKGNHTKSLNLYKFIRLILGSDISDLEIGRRWKMDAKNFHEFRNGRLPVPRLDKLEELANVLGINKHLAFQVGGGAPASKIFDLIKRNDLPGQVKLLTGQLSQAHKSLAQSEKRYQTLFNQANDAILVADTQTGRIVDCNQQATRLLGRPRAGIIGLHQSQIHPPKKKNYYKNHFKRHVRLGRITEFEKAEVIRSDGTVVPVYISARVIQIDGRKCIQGIFRDIRSLKK